MSRDLLAFSPRTPSVPDGPNHEGMTMTSRRPQMLLAIAALVIAPLLGPTASMQPAGRHAVEVEDVIAWKALGSTVLSADGQWFGYRLAPEEADAEVVVRQVRGEKAMRFAIGEVPQGAGGGGRGGAAGNVSSALAFSDDGKWAAFSTYPTRAAALRLKRQRRPIQSGVTVLNLATGEKKEYPKVRRFAFSGESAGWIALHRYGPDGQGGGGAAAAAGGGRRWRGRGPAAGAGPGSAPPPGPPLPWLPSGGGGQPPAARARTL